MILFLSDFSFLYKRACFIMVFSSMYVVYFDHISLNTPCFTAFLIGSFFVLNSLPFLCSSFSLSTPFSHARLISQLLKSKRIASFERISRLSQLTFRFSVCLQLFITEVQKNLNGKGMIYLGSIGLV